MRNIGSLTCPFFNSPFFISQDRTQLWTMIACYCLAMASGIRGSTISFEEAFLFDKNLYTPITARWVIWIFSVVSYKRKNINFKSVKTNKHGLKSNKVIFYFFNGVFKSRVIINMLTSLTDLTNLLIKIFFILCCHDSSWHTWKRIYQFISGLFSLVTGCPWPTEFTSNP